MEKLNTDAPSRLIDHGGEPLPIWMCRACGSRLGVDVRVKPPGCCGAAFVILGDALTASVDKASGKIVAIRELSQP